MTFKFWKRQATKVLMQPLFLLEKSLTYKLWIFPFNEKSLKILEKIHEKLRRQIFYSKLIWSLGKVSKKQKTKMVGLIHRGWLAGVSLGPKSNQKNNCFEKIIQRWSEWSNSSRKLKTWIFHYWGGQGRNPGC